MKTATATATVSAVSRTANTFLKRARRILRDATADNPAARVAEELSRQWSTGVQDGLRLGRRERRDAIRKAKHDARVAAERAAATKYGRRSQHQRRPRP